MSRKKGQNIIMDALQDDIIISATKYLKFRHCGESWNLLKRLDAGSSPA
jgi:hypothetical protein